MKFSPNSAKMATRRVSVATLAVSYLLILAVVLAVASFLPDTDPREVWRSASGEPSDFAYKLWHDLRFKRLIFAGLVGAILGLTGTVFQAVLRNPLAEPYILGISGASALGAVAARLCAGSVVMVSPETLYLVGPLGAAVLGTLILIGLSRWAGLYDPPSLILAGAVLNAIYGALILLFYAMAPSRMVVSSLLWLMGNISSQAMAGPPIPATTVALVLGAVVFLMVARNLDLLSLGEEEAADLGLSPRRFRVVMLIVASLLTGTVVAFTGPIGFIGLVVPHVVRRLHGPGHRRLIPLSMLGGAIFMMICDTLARSVLSRPIPIGAVTALIGGPFFLFLLGVYRRREVA